MADRDEIIAFCDDLLDIQSFGDYGPNGLQVPGRTEISRIGILPLPLWDSLRSSA